MTLYLSLSIAPHGFELFFELEGFRKLNSEVDILQHHALPCAASFIHLWKHLRESRRVRSRRFVACSYLLLRNCLPLKARQQSLTTTQTILNNIFLPVLCLYFKKRATSTPLKWRFPWLSCFCPAHPPARTCK